MTPVKDVILARRSVRAYLPTPVPEEVVREILEVASRAPSGTNMQPWRAYVLTGAARERFCARLVEAHRSGRPTVPTPHYPKQWFDPYLARRRKVGFDLYGLLGIGKGETDRMHGQHARNFRFFDAPVGIIFTIDGRLEVGSWLDYGMFLQNVMIGAQAHGLATCAQAAFAHYADLIAEELDLTDTERVVCGMSLGYADMAAPENKLVTERVSVDEFVSFRSA